MIYVVNKKTFSPSQCKTPYTLFYIGRPSPLGNVFPMKDESQRDEVCDKYAFWLANQISIGTPRVMAELDKLEATARRNDIYLICWCAPKRCHGDSIKRYLEEKLRKE